MSSRSRRTEISGNLSTVSTQLRGRGGGHENFLARLERLDTRRASRGISIDRLAAAAGVRPRSYFYAMRGQFAPRPSTVRALEAALERLVREDALEAQHRLAALWRSTLSLVAVDMGLSAAAVFAADPQANLKGDEFWRAAAQARHRAFYLLVTAHNVPMTQAAEVAGVSKQAVSKALRRVEDGRDDPVRDRELALLASGLGG